MKRKLGFLFECYRLERWNKHRSKKWQKSSFLLDQNGIPICCDKTYNRLIRGEVSPDDEIYDKLLHKLQEDFVAPEHLLQQLLQYTDAIWRAVMTYDSEKIDQLTRSCIKELTPYRSYIYYREAYELIEMIRAYYLQGKGITQKQYEKYEQFLDALHPSSRSITIDLLFHYCQVTYFDRAKLQALADRVCLLEEQSTIHQLNQLQLMLANNQLLSAAELARQLKSIARQHQNANMLASVTTCQMAIALHFDQAQYLSLYQEITELLTDSKWKMQPRIKANSYYTLGIQSFIRKDYESSWLFLNRSIQLRPTNFQEAGIYIRHLEDRLHKTKQNYGRYEQENFSERFQILYRYYKYRTETGLDALHQKRRANESEKERLRNLELYIMKQVLPILCADDPLLKQIFFFEEDKIASLLQSYTGYRKVVREVMNAI